MVAIPMLSRSWWAYAVRGVLALLFGVVALLMPGPTVLSLVLLFAAYALLAGIVYLVGAASNRRHATGAHAADWWLLLMVGVVSVVAGVLALMQPGAAVLALVLIVGVNALITGVLDSVLAVRLRSHARPSVWLLLAGGLASIVFGTILIVLPTVGALALMWLIGTYAVVAGILYMALAFRSFTKEPKRTAGSQPESVQPNRTTPEEGATATQGAWAARAAPTPATQGATMRAGALRKAAAGDRRVGERRMTPAGQH